MSVVMSRLVHPAGRGWQWFLFDERSGHVYAQGFTRYQSVAVSQSQGAAYELAETLEWEVLVNDYAN